MICPILVGCFFHTFKHTHSHTKVTEFLASGINIDCQDHSGATAIQVAAENGHTEIVELLIERGANINASDSNMVSPFLACCRKGLVSCVRLLVDKGADKELLDKNGRGGLFYSVLSENTSLVALMLAWNPMNRNITETFWGWTPLHLAANKVEIILYTRILR